MVHPSERIRGTASTFLSGRRIVLGVAGSIAAVKTVELARELIRHGADVVPVMTPAATRILHPDALHFATGHAPIVALSGAVEHVAAFGVGGDADLLLVAPATANTVAKMALGIDDTALTTYASVALGAKRPVLVAPAMHAPMEENPPTQRHIAALQALGVRFIRPLYEEGKAKLAPVDEIVAEVQRALGPGTLDGKRVLVVSGAGEEAIDPVRIITNRSSGRMGQAIAREAHRSGGDVTVLTTETGADWPPGATVRPFRGVRSLLVALEAETARYDWVFVPAALADYAPEPASTKISSDPQTLDLRLHRLPKVIPEIRRLQPQARIIGWKLQDTLDHAVAAARERLGTYGIDAIVANGAETLGSEEMEAALVTRGAVVELTGSKTSVAVQLFDALTGGRTEYGDEKGGPR